MNSIDACLAESLFGTALSYRLARSDCAVGGLAPELVGVLDVWVGHGIVPSVVVGMHSKASESLPCVSEKTIGVTSQAAWQGCEGDGLCDFT